MPSTGRLFATTRAFTLVEVVVILGVVLVLTAVTLPTIVAQMRTAATRRTAERLEAVRDAMYDRRSGANAFHQKINRNPGRLSELSTIITKNDASYATGTDDSCGNAFKNAQVTDWENNGPFVNFHIDRVNGLETPIGRAEDSLTRIPSGGGPGVLRVNFLNNVDVEDATMLDMEMDGGDGNAAGTVQWLLPASAGRVTMYYFIPVNEDC